MIKNEITNLKRTYMLESIKYGYRLWFDLSYYIWSEQWQKASEQCELISEYGRKHPILNKLFEIF